MVQQVLKRLAGDGDSKASHACVVRGTKVTGMVDLFEVNFLGGTLGGAPLLDASLQRA